MINTDCNIQGSYELSNNASESLQRLLEVLVVSWHQQRNKTINISLKTGGAKEGNTVNDRCAACHTTHLQQIQN